MPQQHPWPGVTHHLADAVAHFRFVTMNVAVRAGRFVDTERTAIKTPYSIVVQFGTLRAKLAFRRVMMATINLKHRDDGLLLAFHSLKSRCPTSLWMVRLRTKVHRYHNTCH